MLNLQAIDHRSQLAENLICPLVEFKLCGDQIRQVPQGLGGVQDLKTRHGSANKVCALLELPAQLYIFHHADGLLSLADKLVLGLLDLGTCLLAQVVQVTTGLRLLARLDRVQHQTGVLDVAPGLGREHQVRVERGVPSGQEARLDLSVLRQTGLADLLRRKGVLLERRRQRVLAGRVLRQRLRSRQRGAGDGVVEGLGLGLIDGGSGQGGLGLGGGSGLREKLDLLADSTAEVVEGFTDVGRVVVSFVGVLGAVDR